MAAHEQLVVVPSTLVSTEHTSEAPTVEELHAETLDQSALGRLESSLTATHSQLPLSLAR